MLLVPARAVFVGWWISNLRLRVWLRRSLARAKVFARLLLQKQGGWDTLWRHLKSEDDFCTTLWSLEHLEEPAKLQVAVVAFSRELFGASRKCGMLACCSKMLQTAGNLLLEHVAAFWNKKAQNNQSSCAKSEFVCSKMLLPSVFSGIFSRSGHVGAFWNTLEHFQKSAS